MTTKLLLRTTALTCALMLGFIAPAQVRILPIQESFSLCPSGKQKSNMKFSSVLKLQQKQQEEANMESEGIVKAEGDRHLVTLALECNDDLYQSPRAYFFPLNSNLYSTSAHDNGNGALEARVSEGIYDIVCWFTNFPTRWYIIFEQVEINDDLTLTLNPSECTNLIATKYYSPDGELLKHGFGHFDENDQWVVDSQGPIYYTAVFNELFHRDLGGLISIHATFSGEQYEEFYTCPLNVYVNDISNRFVFLQHRIDFTEDFKQSYCNWSSIDNVKDGIHENNPESYVQQLYNYKYTPYGCSHDGFGCENTFLWGTTNYLSSTHSVSIYSFEQKENGIFTHEVWANIPQEDPCVPEMNILLQTNFGDYKGIALQEGSGAEYPTITGWTLGTPIWFKNGQKEFVNYGHHERNWEGKIFFNSIYIDQLPAPEPLTYPCEQVLGVINDNCPINALNVQTVGKTIMGITNYYVGRNGETLCCDEGVITKTKYNGIEVDLSSFVAEAKGIYEHTTTNTNIEVDGLPGHNTTMVYFDQNQVDMTPPSIEMLHFKNADGKVIDRFATAADGTIEFYASDFHFHFSAEVGYLIFECQPVEVTVEYAPYGTEDWNELAVEEIPEYYQEPGWGYFYRGTLEGVTGQGEKGWFDLRFRLQDASGNWQEQVVSPAFRIDDQAYSSVATISSDNAREVARYNLAGQRVDADATGVVIIKMSDGTARKVLK